MKKALIGTALVIGMIGSAAAATNCSSFPNNVVTGNVNDDVFASGYTCTIAASAFVNGNVLQVGDGDLVIRGIVNGAAEETGNGSIIVAKGEDGGNLTEADAGNITIRGGSTIKGSVEEAGIGSVFVTVDLPGVVNADILESGPGSVTVTVNAGYSFKGSVEEYDAGSVLATLNGFFEGNIAELDLGNLETRGAGTFKGNSEHALPGTCVNSIADFQGAVCNLL